jgi:hypothetical protein
MTTVATLRPRAASHMGMIEAKQKTAAASSTTSTAHGLGCTVTPEQDFPRSAERERRCADFNGRTVLLIPQQASIQRSRPTRRGRT